MKGVFLFLLCLSCITLAFSICSNCPSAEYEVNLDLPPQERWKQIINDFMPDGKLVLEMMAEMLPSYFDDWWDNYVKDNLVKIFGEDVVAELQAWANQIDVELKKVVKCQFFYTLGNRCSFILTRDHTGVPILAHNFDAGFHSILGKMILQYKWTRNGKPIAYTTSLWGFLGAFSAMKISDTTDGAFGITFDGRNTRNGSHEINFNHLKNGAKLSEFLMRALVTSPRLTYSLAEHALEYTHIAAPVYIGIAGSRENQMAAFVRSHTSSDTYRLNPPSTWFLRLTNSDPQEPCERMKAIDKMMETQVRSWSNVNETTIMQVLSTPPVYMPQATDFQNWIVPSSSVYKTNLPWMKE